MRKPPAAEAPVEEAPAAETPAEEVPAAETPVEEAPAAETPVEEAPAAVTPVEEVPAAETPVEEAPAAEAPAVEQVAEEEETAEEPTVVSYPPVTFPTVYVQGGIRVDVSAEAGALPEGTELKVTQVPVYEVADQVAEVTEGKVLFALDIAFWYNGVEIEPVENTNVSVSIKSAAIAATETVEVVHIDSQNEVSTVEQDVDTAANEAAFTTDSFSVYVVVGNGNTGDNARVPVNFISKGTTIATMYVKNGDTASELETILYDPGVGTLGAGEQFLGWTLVEESAITADSERKTIAQVRSYMEELSITEGMDPVNFYAVISKTVTVRFVDTNDVVLSSESARLIGSETSADITLNQAYITDGTHNFEGWVVTDGTSNIVAATYDGAAVTGGTEENPYQNGTVLTVKGDVVLGPQAPEGHWLVFDENGKGGTYNAPHFLESGDVTEKPRPDAEMQRFGYTFTGWYADAACTTPFTFGSTITENTTIYAGWRANATAGYTVLIWKQNVDGEHYDFAQSVSLTGNVGATVNTVTATGNGDGRYASVNGTAYRYTGFRLDHYDTGKTINTEGTTVVNVYYNRNTITLTFQYRQNNSWNTQITMTGLYGQTLESQGYTWPTNRWWYDSYSQQWGSYSGAGTRTTFLDAFIIADGSSSQIFYGFSGDGNRTRYFYKLNADGDGYTLANTVTGSGSFNISDKYNGYKAVGYRTSANGQWHTLTTKDSNGYYATNLTDNTLYIYYDPILYNINYYDGVYVDGNGNPVSGYESRGQLNEVDDIPYNSSTTSYNKGGANYYEPTFKGFVFEGWYVDDQCTQAYTFTTMPEGITVYAKWRQVQYRVFLHPNADRDTTLDWGSDTQAMNFRISYGGKVDTPEGRRIGYEFLGWFFADGTVYSDTAFVLNDETVPASPAYDKTTDFTDPMDKWGDGATTNADVNRFWITRKLDIYGDWAELTIGAKGIGIVYDANGGSNAPSDTMLYKDKAYAVGQGAPTPPADKVFKCWILQIWNGSAYVDTSTEVLPGGEFQVLRANSKIVDLSSGQDITVDQLDENGSYSYTIQLRAEYVDPEEVTPTHITWYSNLQDVSGNALTLNSFGHTGITTSDSDKGWYVTDKADGTLLINEAIDIRSAETYTYPGYTFLGWAKKADATADGLFLKWDAENEEFLAQVNGEWKAVTQVAADEKQPYDDLYAIWEGEFYVYHSGVAGGNVETVKINKENLAENGTYNLTQNLTPNTLYGGYYLDGGFTAPEKVNDQIPAYDGDNWTWTEAETTNGMAITPVCGTTYYIKEAPANKFLQPYTHYTYQKGTYKISTMWMISDIDDLNYEETGFYVISNNKAKVCRTLTVKTAVGNTKLTLKPETVFRAKGATSDDYLTYLTVIDASLGENNIVKSDDKVIMYWITPDGLIVTGTAQRQLQGVDNVRNLKKVDSTVASTVTAPSEP